MAKNGTKAKITNGQFLWLSLLLLILIVEAVYMLKFQQQNNVEAQYLQTLELNITP